MERAARWVQENLQTRAALGAPEVTTGQAFLSAIRAEATRQDATVEGQRLAAGDANRTPNVVRGDGTMKCPAGYPVKGNADSGLYHEPGSSSYAQMIPEFCFTSASAAEAAGFHAPV